MSRGKGWTATRIGLNLDQETLDYIESQRTRLGSLTRSELVRDLLREHQRMQAGDRADRDEGPIGTLRTHARAWHAPPLGRGRRRFG